MENTLNKVSTEKSFQVNLSPRQNPPEEGMNEPVIYFNEEQVKGLLHVAGDAGLTLMQHYVAIAHQPNPNMEDQVLSTMLGKSVKAIEATRLKLTKAGWFKRLTHTTKGKKIITYLVGKEAVNNHGYIAHLANTKDKKSIE